MFLDGQFLNIMKYNTNVVISNVIFSVAFPSTYFYLHSFTALRPWATLSSVKHRGVLLLLLLWLLLLLLELLLLLLVLLLFQLPCNHSCCWYHSYCCCCNHYCNSYYNCCCCCCLPWALRTGPWRGWQAPPAGCHPAAWSAGRPAGSRPSGRARLPGLWGGGRRRRKRDWASSASWEEKLCMQREPIVRQILLLQLTVFAVLVRFVIVSLLGEEGASEPQPQNTAACRGQRSAIRETPTGQA